MNARIARLRESLEEPLLVTNGKNVVYLVGFESSNAALLVDPERVQLFTDFRYIQAARAVEGVEVVQTKRGVIGELANLLNGTVGFEAATLAFAQVETLRARRAGPRPAHGSRRGAARGQGRRRARFAPPRLQDRRPGVRAPGRRGAVHRPDRARRRRGT